MCALTMGGRVQIFYAILVALISTFKKKYAKILQVNVPSKSKLTLKKLLYTLF